MRALPVVLLLGLSLSGCLAGSETDPAVTEPVREVSEKLWDVLPVEEVFVAATDGTRLHNAVYRPDTDEPVPVFINFSPYWGDTAEAGGDGFARYLVEEYVPRGYAVVLAAVRGTGHSEGCFEVASDREVADLWDVIDHFANEPWSNGRVAAGGKSYDSTTQNGLVAKMPHPNLEAIFHVSGITDMYRYNYVGGVPYQNGLTFTPRYAVTYGTDGTHPEGEPFGTLDALGCQEMAEHAASGTGSAAHGMKDAYWQERDWNRYVAQSEWDGSIFFVHGFQDWNVKPDHVLPWLTELPPQVRVKAWLHQDTENNGHVYPMRDDWNATMLAWLDAELKGYDNGFWNGPAFELEGTDGLWRQSDQWPPAEPPSRLRGKVEEASYRVFPRTGEQDFVVSYDLARNGTVRLTGAPLLHLNVIPYDADPILTATLLERDRGGTETWVGEAVLRAVYRDGLDAPSPVTPSQPLLVTLTAYPLDVVLEQGHELVVRFGQQARHSITPPEALLQVFYDPDARLEVHVLPADAQADQPEPTPCFAC